MSMFYRGPAPRRSGSVAPKAPQFPRVDTVSKPRTFEFTPHDKILIEACKTLTGIVLCGGWVRDKILGLKPKDYDLIVAHEKYDALKLNLAIHVKKLAERDGFTFQNLSEPVVSRPKIGKRPLRCGFDFICYKFRLTNTTTGETTDMEIDAKQLYPGQEFTSDITRRDFSVNCLLYSIKNDFIACREQDYFHVSQKKLQHAVSVEETMTDPVRFLRAFRLKHEKGLQFSKELESYLRIDKGQKFSGYFFKTPSQHSKKASPLEYKKIINQSPVLHACIAEIYEYGYIFKWRSPGTAAQLSEKANSLSRGLQRKLDLEFFKVRNWAGWQHHAENEYFTRAFLVALAVFDLDKNPAADKHLDFVENVDFYLLMTAFIPEMFRTELSGFLSKLAEDYKQGVAELSGLREYRRAFRPDLPTVLVGPELLVLEKATPKSPPPVREPVDPDCEEDDLEDQGGIPDYIQDMMEDQDQFDGDDGVPAFIQDLSDDHEEEQPGFGDQFEMYDLED